MHVETQKGATESEIRNARIYRDAERLDLPGPVSFDLTVDGPDVRLDAGCSAGASEISTSPDHTRRREANIRQVLKGHNKA